MPSKEVYRQNPLKYRQLYISAYHKDKPRFKQYKENHIAKHGRKRLRIDNWKRSGMKLFEGENWDQMYDIYINQDLCCGCGRHIPTDSKRCLDHNHLTGEIRGVLCYSCNKRDVLANI